MNTLDLTEAAEVLRSAWEATISIPAVARAWAATATDNAQLTGYRREDMERALVEVFTTEMNGRRWTSDDIAAVGAELQHICAEQGHPRCGESGKPVCLTWADYSADVTQAELWGVA